MGFQITGDPSADKVLDDSALALPAGMMLDHHIGTRTPARAVALAEVVGLFFVAQHDDTFAVDGFHPSGAGHRRTAKAMLASALAALGHQHPLSPGHYPPAS